MKTKSYHQIHTKSQYHQSVGGILRQELAAEKRQARHRRTVILLSVIAIIIATVFFSSILGMSHITADYRPDIFTSHPFVLVEFGTILVLDDDPPSLQNKGN